MHIKVYHKFIYQYSYPLVSNNLFLFNIADNQPQEAARINRFGGKARL